VSCKLWPTSSKISHSIVTQFSPELCQKHSQRVVS